MMRLVEIFVLDESLLTFFIEEFISISAGLKEFRGKWP